MVERIQDHKVNLLRAFELIEKVTIQRIYHTYRMQQIATTREHQGEQEYAQAADAAPDNVRASHRTYL